MDYLLKCVLGRVVRAMSARTIHRLDAAISYLETGRKIEKLGPSAVNQAAPEKGFVRSDHSAGGALQNTLPGVWGIRG